MLQASEVLGSAEQVRGMSRRCFQYRLRSLLLISAAVAAISGVVGPQLRGRLQIGHDVDFSSGPSPKLVFVCATEDDAHNLSVQFDRDQFCSQLDSIVGRNAPASSRVLSNVSVNTWQSRNCFFIAYDFTMWGRHGLDLRKMTYVWDCNDPGARSRNAAIHRAFQQAGEALAQSSPAIQTWSHFP